ncbi:MAG: hypothetical protein M3O87_05995, partial [Candidatus Dormibacteraeota bacterium]|nr:hypothetical protein [Candidatus Dormibacteraeota bacterium]
LQRLYALMDASTARPSNKAFLVDYGLGVTPASDIATNPPPVGVGSSQCAAPSGSATVVAAPGGGLPGTSAPSPINSPLWPLVALAAVCAVRVAVLRRR